MHERLVIPPARTGRTLSRAVQLAILAVLAVLGAAIIAGFSLRFAERGEPAVQETAVPDGAFRPTEAQWTGLKIAAVEALTFHSTRVADGRIAIDEDRTTPVFSPYSGRVTRLLARAGDHVDQGAPLLAVEASEFVQGQNDLIAAIAALNKARAQLTLARGNERRQHELYEAKAAALRDWEQAQADLAAAQGDFRSATTALGAVRNRLRILGKTDAEIDRLETAGRIDPEVTVAAPIGGTVTQRKVGLGQYIAAGASDPVFVIGDLSTVWLVAQVRETDAPAMRVGQPIEVRVLAYPGRVFKATLAYVAPAVDPNTHRLPVRAEVENPDQALKPEMFASFSITVGRDVAAPAVPADAVVYEGVSARVWIAQDDGTIVSRAIRVGRSSDDGMVEVLAGLTPGEKIVTSGTLFIDRAARGD